MSELKVVNHYATLSAAIRAGAKLAPGCAGQLLSLWKDGTEPHTCALGAAVHALLGRLPDDTEAEYQMIFDAFPYTRSFTGCPIEGCDMHQHAWSLRNTVFHLNDAHRWTREAVADWLEQWENEHLGFETLVEAEKGEEASEQQVQYAQCSN